MLMNALFLRAAQQNPADLWLNSLDRVREKHVDVSLEINLYSNPIKTQHKWELCETFVKHVSLASC